MSRSWLLLRGLWRELPAMPSVLYPCKGSFDCAGSSLCELPAPLRMTTVFGFGRILLFCLLLHAALAGLQNPVPFLQRRVFINRNPAYAFIGCFKNVVAVFFFCES